MEFFRNLTTGNTGKVLIILFAIPFIFMAFSRSASQSANESNVAIVNGDKITQVAVDKRVNRQKQSIIRQLGDNFDPEMLDEEKLQKQELDNLIKQRLVLQAANSAGLKIADDEIAKMIRALPVFQVEGTFSKDLYRNLLAQQGIKIDTFPQLMAEEMIVAQHAGSIANSEFSTDAEVHMVEQLSEQTRDAYYTTIRSSEFLQSIVVDEEQILSWYEENAGMFQSDELFQIDYIEIKASDYTAGSEPDAEEVLAAYKEEVLAAEHMLQLELAHILVSVNEERTRKEAGELISEIESRLLAGELFADLALEYSDDFTTASNGGVLPGQFLKRTLADELPGEFVGALSGMVTGDISEPVETDDGIHLILLRNEIRPEIPTFESRKVALTNELAEYNAESLFQEQREEMALKKQSSSSLDMLADQMQLKIQSTALLAEAALPPVFKTVEIVKELHSDQVFKDRLMSQLMDGDDNVVVFQIANFTAAQTKPLEQVRADVIAGLKHQLAVAQLSALATEMLNKTHSQDSLKDVLSSYSRAVESKVAVTRSATDVAPEVLKFIFKAPAPGSGAESVSRVDMVNGDITLLAVTKVNTPELAQGIALQPKIKALGERNGTLVMASFVDYLQDQAEISRRY